MSTMHVYLVTEDDFVEYHVTAASEADAIGFVQERVFEGGAETWDAEQLPDNRVFTMTLVDSSCDPEDPDVAAWIGQPGYVVDLNGEHPTVSAPCSVWAASSTEPQYLTCSEW